MTWPDALETEGLLKRVENHEPEAVDRLWKLHRDPLRRMIAARIDARLARRVDASDMVQEVLLKAGRRLGDYLRAPSLPFHLWLRQIARDHLIDQHRKHRVAGKRSLDREQSLAARAFAGSSSIDLAGRLKDPGLTPAASLLRAELERRFQVAIALLDDDDREIVVLRHFEQLPNAEVAKILGVSEPAAGMRHLRALRRLRGLLGESPSMGGIAS